ncbi:unnamed protein product [Aphanomyces euteiches]
MSASDLDHRGEVATCKQHLGLLLAAWPASYSIRWCDGFLHLWSSQSTFSRHLTPRSNGRIEIRSLQRGILTPYDTWNHAWPDCRSRLYQAHRHAT